MNHAGGHMRLFKPLISGLLIGTLTIQVTGCGSIFYPDRRGQIGGDVDPLIAGLDALGLLLYIVPGVVALSIDFTTGAIYIPHTRRPQYSLEPQKLHETLQADGQVDRARLKMLLEQELGYSLPLEDPQVTLKRVPRQILAQNTDPTRP